MRERLSDHGRVRDAATALPFVAAILLAPPLIVIFAAPLTISGIPLIFLYVFGVWALVILATLLLARRLGRPDGEAER